MAQITLTLDAVEQLAQSCLLANGCNADNANAVADTILQAERDGCHSHGLLRLPGYVAALKSGKVDGHACPEVTAVSPSMLRVDAGGGFAPLALNSGRPALIEAAKTHGVAIMAITRSHHFAALWVEVEPLARAGLAALACTAYMPAMPPAGGNKPFFGTNPMAFGWPRGTQPPMVFDMAAAAMAKGEVLVAARDGHELPAGTGLDRDGKPTTDAQAIIDGGMLLPFGGYKGSGIAMMIELLAAGLIGERFSFEAAAHDNKDGGPPRGGEFILAIDPGRLGGDDWLAHCESFFAAMLAIDGTRLPGDRRHANRAQTPKTGIPVPEALLNKIKDLGGQLP